MSRNFQKPNFARGKILKIRSSNSHVYWDTLYTLCPWYKKIYKSLCTFMFKRKPLKNLIQKLSYFVEVTLRLVNTRQILLLYMDVRSLQLNTTTCHVLKVNTRQILLLYMDVRSLQLNTTTCHVQKVNTRQILLLYMDVRKLQLNTTTCHVQKVNARQILLLYMDVRSLQLNTTTCHVQKVNTRQILQYKFPIVVSDVSSCMGNHPVFNNPYFYILASEDINGNCQMFEMDNTVNQDETLFKAEICLCNKDRFAIFFE